MLNNDMINMLLQIENENNEKKDYIQELISFFYSIQYFFSLINVPRTNYWL